jgi:hypothetical protein
MSALVALGALASASQLVVYGKSIIFHIADLYDRAQDAPQDQRGFKMRLHLWDLESGVPLDSFSDIDQEGELKLVLAILFLQAILCHPNFRSTTCTGPRKYWAIITGTEERQILLHLENLNKKNAGLLLCISTVNSSQLSNLNANMVKLVEGIEELAPKYGTLEDKDVSTCKSHIDLKLQQSFYYESTYVELAADESRFEDTRTTPTRK